MPSVDHPKATWTQKWKRLAASPSTHRILVTALAGYAVVGLFALVYRIVRSSWPDQTQATSITIAALAAAPLALALIWDRLGEFKAFGLELTLITSSPQMESEVVEIVGGETTQSQVFSDSLQEIAKKITQVFAQPEQELLELNLRDGDYWLSTRLFLVAALTEDYSRLSRLVFVERGCERIFVGMAVPGDVRRALAKEWPNLELAYQEIKHKPPADPSRSDPEPSRIVLDWIIHLFKVDGQSVSDSDPRLSVKVDTASLNRWLGNVGMRLTTESADWDGITRPHLVRSLLVEFDSAYVALLRQRRLDRVVHRPDLALRVARQALGLPASTSKPETS